MNKRIRIKSYFHILQHETVIDFVKTLDETVKLPAGDFFNGFLETIQNYSDEEELAFQMATKFNVHPASAKQFLEQLFALGVIEYYHENIPASLNRYHRQLLFFDSVSPQKDFEENYSRQEKLMQTYLLIIGIGGIGNFFALSLVAAGVGKITLVDSDVVEETNLNRQVLFNESDLGKSKVEIAAMRLKELNASCIVNQHRKNISSQNNFDKLLSEIDKVDYIMLSADKPVDLVLWASALCKKYLYKYIKCGYMAYQGLIGPLLGPETKTYEELFQSWADDISSQSKEIKLQNESHIAASIAAGNGILANIAALEIIKDITGIIPSVLHEKRICMNLKTMEIAYG